MNIIKKDFCFDTIKRQRVVASADAMIELKTIENVTKGSSDSFLVLINDAPYEVDEPTYYAIESKIQ